ncbi:MAG: hypothetical protein ACJ754_01685 [Pyrinomonadaceae bacterium]
MSNSQDPPIVISGGSVTIEFDPRTFGDTGAGRYSSQEKVIKRVEVVGAGIPNYDEAATGSDITVRITYGNP